MAPGSSRMPPGASLHIESIRPVAVYFLSITETMYAKHEFQCGLNGQLETWIKTRDNFCNINVHKKPSLSQRDIWLPSGLGGLT